MKPHGARLWRLCYRIRNREKLISLGIYPDVPLKRAREKRDEARRLIADEIDPSTERNTRREAMLVTFEGVAQESITAVEVLAALRRIAARGRHETGTESAP